MLDFENLSVQVYFDGYPYYLPEDPFGIYHRLLNIFVKERKVFKHKPTIESSKLKYKHNILKSLTPSDYTNFNNSSFDFLVWITQSLPEKFWLYNNFITANIDEIRKSAEDYDCKQVWIDMPNKENKIKLANLTNNVVFGLRYKTLSIPSYDNICKQIYSWGKKTKYKYGLVKEVLI